LLDLSHLEAASALEVVSWALETYGDSFAIATAFQKEGMVIVDLAARISPRVRVFTLDTGRLPGETLSFVETVVQRYGIAIETVLPDPGEVAAMVSTHGLNLFYDSLEGRQLCCEIRKVRPLQRKLREVGAWAAGLRREQAETRADVPKAQWVDGRVKLNPLADWSSAQVEQYIRENSVPVHPLYEHGYTSIGCAPCTRAVAPGEDSRAGRWWWEQNERKECGIHFAADGSARRDLPVDSDA
jgi:thioredoxin-dependent adenylylsulfate APS reductase